MSDKYVRLTSPAGTLRWPKLTEPDYKFDADGVYTTRLVLPAGQAQVMIDRITAELDKNFEATVEKVREDKGAAAAKKVRRSPEPWSEVLDEDGEETGEIEFRFKLNAVGRDRKTGREWKNRVVLFDASRQPIKGNLNIWGGSTGIVAFDLIPYFNELMGAGISLRLRAVQIVNLVSGTSVDPDEYGFDDVEGGYEFDPEDAAAATTVPDDAEAGGADSGETPPPF